MIRDIEVIVSQRNFFHFCKFQLEFMDNCGVAIIECKRNYYSLATFISTTCMLKTCFTRLYLVCIV
jgi:hypothetical protein